jgi:uncharacterized membrane protein (UPF0182 family)
MRVPSDLPRPRRERLGQRGRIGLVVAAIVLFLLLTSLRGIAGFYTDLLWFDSLGYRQVFTGVLRAKASLAVLFSAVFFVVLWLNLFLADRFAPRFRPAGPEEEVIERYHDLIGNRVGLVRTVVALLFAAIAGAGVSSHWNDWILFTHSQKFGVKDAQFHTDAGFYVFKLPFLSFVVDWAFASLVIILIVTAVAHYLNGGIRLQNAAQRVTPQVKAHLSVLLGVLAVVKAAGYYLQRYELTLSTRGTVDGATYTDVKAQLPAIRLLMVISLMAAILLVVNIWRRGWVLPILAVGLWAFVAVIVGGIYPAIVQKVQVRPAESSKERPYIGRNIEATRFALGLNAVDNVSFPASTALDAAGLEANTPTVRNIRLWDPADMQLAFENLQEGRSFYRINDVDVDRYLLDGELTEVELGVRNLNTAETPQKSWEAQHLIYTHGHGVVLAPANAKDANGRPSFVLRDVPVKSAGGITIKQPAVYIGENLGGYVVTNTKRQEVDYQGDRTATNTYGGKDGVGMGSYLRRAAFALRFGDVNPLISGNITGKSKILFQRDVRERAKELAPFLEYDHDPYAVIVGGRIKYVLDAYTTSTKFPYGQRAERDDLPDGSGLDKGFNYVRNSIKVVVDAYDGTTNFYVVDGKDPIARAYREAFPKLFTDGDQVPTELRSHFRTPEDLFVIQTNMWGRYHLTNPDDFYTRSGAWVVAQNPELAQSTSTPSTVPGQAPVATRAQRIEPYYLLTQLPGEDSPSFVLFRPFVRFSADDRRQELSAFMVANSDPDQYGDLKTFVMPNNRQIDGPSQAAANMKSDDAVSQTETFLGQTGSRVIHGNVVIVPINGALLYVRPLYVVAENGPQIPELRKVIAAYNGEVAIDNTLKGALSQIFGAAPPTREETVDGGGPAVQPPDENVADLLAQAVQSFSDADAALRSGDLGTYQAKVKEGRDLVTRAQSKSGTPSSSTTTTSTTQPADA